MANYLPPAKRANVIDMATRGASMREIAARTGVNKATVATAVQQIAADRKALAKIARTLAEAASELYLQLAWSCPLHPEADPIRDFDPDGSGCLLCSATTAQRRSRGLQRHHVRRKAEGRPIVPPWRRDL